MRQCLLCALLVCSLFVNASTKDKYSSDSVTISIQIPTQQSVRFTYYDDFLVRKDLVFRNPSEKDSVITKQIFTKNIAELRYSVLNDISNESYFYVIYLKGGDSIILKEENFRLKNLTSNKYLLITDFLSINDSVFASQGAGDRIKANKATYERNLHIIDSLNSSQLLNDSVTTLWKGIAWNFYALINMRMRYSKTLYLDTLVNELKEVLSNEQKINSNFLNGAIYSLGNYSKVKNGTTHNLKLFIEEVIKIKTASRYKAGVIFQELYNFSEKNSQLYKDSYALFEREFTDPYFKEQSYYASVNPTAVRFDKKTINLISYQNKAFTLQDIFKANYGKIIVFDFWASWCVPCITEFPSLEQAKTRLADKNIVFITISLDKDQKEKDWKGALNRNGIKPANQFRVVGPSIQLISMLYKIQTIPRYLVFDKKGLLIADNFVRPSAKDFEKKLLAYLN